MDRVFGSLKYTCHLCKMVVDHGVKIVKCVKNSNYNQHIFCLGCLKTYLINHNCKCPIELEEKTHESHNCPEFEPVTNIEQQILHADVRCIQHGCEWRGKCSQYRHHTRTRHLGVHVPSHDHYHYNYIQNLESRLLSALYQIN